jgi:hypothetical protein
MAFQWLHDNNGVACRAGSRTFGSSQGALPPLPPPPPPPKAVGWRQEGNPHPPPPQNWTKHKIPCPLVKNTPACRRPLPLGQTKKNTACSMTPGWLREKAMLIRRMYSLTGPWRCHLWEPKREFYLRPGRWGIEYLSTGPANIRGPLLSLFNNTLFSVYFRPSPPPPPT